MKPTTRDGILRGGRAALIRLLLLAAAGISAYLLSVSLSGGAAVGCGPGSGCDEVLKSRWAYVFGIPVSALALVVDAALLLTTFACGPKSSPKQRRGAWEILAPGAVLVLGAALWFVAVQAIVLQRFCPWCMAAHGCGAVAAVLLLMRLPVTAVREKGDKSPALPQSTLLKLAVAAVVAVAVLGIAQTVAPRKTYSMTTVPDVLTNDQRMISAPNVAANASPPVAGAPVTNNPPQPATNLSAVAQAKTLPAAVGSNVMTVFGNRFALNLNDVPVIGPATAPLRMLSLFDYTCHHCQEMHEHVVEVQRLFSNQLAVVSLPMPLDAQCNRLMTRGTPPPHVNACTYAKIGLAVWRARRSALLPFDDWIFAQPSWKAARRAPPLNEVTNKAVELVGAMMFDKAMSDPWVDAQIRTNVEMYETSYKEFRNGSMPQFLIGTNLVTGTLTVEQLRAVVEPYAKALPAL